MRASDALAGARATLSEVENVTVALAVTLGSALLRACTVTDPPAGIVSGAVYVVVSGAICEFRIDPFAAFPPTTPLTSHVTLASCAPVTVAWNVCVPPSAIVAEVGETETATAGRIETEMDAAFVGSACGVARICTVAGEGGTEGAVYTPLEEIVPQPAPMQPVPVTLQEITRLGFELGAVANAAV